MIMLLKWKIDGNVPAWNLIRLWHVSSSMHDGTTEPTDFTIPVLVEGFPLTLKSFCMVEMGLHVYQAYFVR